MDHWVQAAHGNDRFTGPFAVWLDSDVAVVCDREEPLEPGCRVLWIENGWGIAEGLILKMQRPDKAKGVTVRLLDYAGSDVLQIARSDVVRIHRSL